MPTLNQSPPGAVHYSKPHRVFIDLTNNDDDEIAISRITLPSAAMPASRPIKVLSSSGSHGVVGYSLKPPAILPPTRAQPPTSFNSNDDTMHPAKRRRTETPPTVTRILPPKPTYLINPQSTRVLPRRNTTHGAVQGQTSVEGKDRHGISLKGGSQIKGRRLHLTSSRNKSRSVEVDGAEPVEYQLANKDRVGASKRNHSNPKLAEAYVGSEPSDSGSEDIFDSVTAPRKYSSSPTTSLDHKDHSKTAKVSQILPPSSRYAYRSRSSASTKAAKHKVNKAHGLSNSKKPLKISKPASRPYLNYEQRQAFRYGLDGASAYISKKDTMPCSSSIHVDFNLEEIEIIYKIAMNERGQGISQLHVDHTLPKKLISLLLGEKAQIISKICLSLKAELEKNSKDKGMTLLKERDDISIRNFLQDVTTGNLAILRQDMRLSVQQKSLSALRLSHLLLQREIDGCYPNRICGGKESFRQVATSMLADQMVRQSEWTDCCGDITSITWTSQTGFICGATAHSDSHNMQYNKPGNLVIGSTTTDTLRSVDRHRIIRPEVDHEDNAENALQSMRNTQDPWLYTSVVSTAFCTMLDLAFTASFDQTVKVWSAQDSEMELRGAWYHSANVNFVIASEHHDLVATACDDSVDAVRVYDVNVEDITNSHYVTYCGNRTQGQELKKWAYFPATIQWGSAKSVSHLLLVGYSPRSLTQDDMDIPEDRRNTGELCLWNTVDDTRIVITAASMQNVFEVKWHPSQPIFLAATSPSGNFEPSWTKTQIRMFGQTTTETWTHLKTLDCPALDINELTIMPNSRLHSYVTASCTDGNTYVYDTSQGDQAIHVLKHGDSLDNPLHDIPRDLADTGVKFAAWGENKNRFYTGASDGRVKVWDVTVPPCHAFVKDLLVVSAGISAGAFSEDRSQLVIGDASGKVHLLRIDDGDLESEEKPSPAKRHLASMQKNSWQALRNGGLLPAALKRPKVLIPHPEPAPPKRGRSQSEMIEDVEKSGKEVAAELIKNGSIRIHPDPAIGAVQGPNYASTNLFRYEAHEDFDGSRPLLPNWQAKQKSFEIDSKQHTEFALLPRMGSNNSSSDAHVRNVHLDLELSNLSLETRQELDEDGVEWNWDQTFDYELFPGKKFPLFKEDSSAKKLRKSLEREAGRNKYMMSLLDGDSMMEM